jgi:hypothetical protein
MKRLLFIVSMVFVTGSRLFAQEDSVENNEKIRDKMNEYIQKRLELSKDESAKFSPVFLHYFKEWRQTIRENKGDRLIMQQKIIDLRLRYRAQFRQIIGEQRGDQVFNHQERFIRELRGIQMERIRNNPAGGRPLLRNRTNFIIK